MNAIQIQDKKAWIDADACVECGVCYRVGVCPADAIQREKLIWPRTLRAAFSDPLNIHTETNMAGRGTSEMKTNDVTGRFRRGKCGIALELGRPGIGTRMSEIEKITRVLCEEGMVLEPLNPLSRLIDGGTGEVSSEIRKEKVLSAVVEFSVDEERLIPILQKIQRQAGQLDTVMSVGVAYRSDREGSFQEVLRRLDQAGFFYRENVKMNMGLGSPLYQEAEGEI